MHCVHLMLYENNDSNSFFIHPCTFTLLEDKGNLHSFVQFYIDNVHFKKIKILDSLKIHEFEDYK